MSSNGPRKAALAFILMILAAPFAEAKGPPRCRVAIPEGRVAPLFGLPKNTTSVTVKSFAIDCDAVTVKEFAEFLKEHADWQPSAVPRLFADERYLKDFGDRLRNPKQQNLPVVYVSWFAADAFCHAQGGRLATTFEWERVAAASAKKESAPDDPETTRLVLDWYAKPSSTDLNDNRAALEKANYFGVRGLHGVIWEWTSDFGGFRMTQDNRQQGDNRDEMFCGAAANTAENRTNYAAFMRYALRGSLEGAFSLPNLGFRCAYENAL